MNLEHIRARCEKRLRDLDVPLSSDPAVFCAALASRRGRAIELVPAAMDGGLSALCIAGKETDYIFYKEDTTPWHQRHVILHEVGHLLCEHGCGRASGPKAEAAVRLLLQRLFPDLDAGTVRGVLYRDADAAIEEQEQEAELLATMLMQRMSQFSIDGLTASPELPAIDRLRTVLAGRHTGKA